MAADNELRWRAPSVRGDPFKCRAPRERGIRLPRSVLEECRLGATVDLSVEDGVLVVRPVPAPRAGWDEAFGTMVELGDDTLLDAEAPVGTDWDEQEWEWPDL